MYRSLKCLVMIAALAAAAPAAAQTGAFELPEARSARSGAGGALTAPSDAGARAVLAQYLRGSGRDAATLASLAESNRSGGRQGITHVQFEQRVGGLPVYGTYVKASFGPRGELISVTENLATVPADVRRAAVTAQQAIAAAVRNLYPALRTIPAGFFRNNGPSAERVVIAQPDGSMAQGFLVETWTERSNQLHESLVDGGGNVLYVESRTQTADEYNVFRVSPTVTPQAIAPGPGAGNVESPQGWLFSGTQNSTNIAGNNVRAYLDVVSDNAPDNAGSAVADGHFHTAADLASSPATSQNRNVAVQNLFYLNNLIHDELYRLGFIESAFNFQESNFGKGGRGSDSVNAEAQDGGGTDNANFSTPRDGQNPRMQMYLWTGAGPTHLVQAGGQTFGAKAAAFGGTLTTTGISSTIVLVADGGGVSSTDACEAITNNVAGAIALIDRGNCDFVVKVKNAQNAGAIGALVANNTGTEEIIIMGGTDATITIPALGVSLNSGNTLKAMVPVAGTMKLADVQPLQIDADIDADIVFHEYCHGLTWRMIGSMSGPIAGALGEGMSDVCAFMLTALDENGQLRPGADVVAEYSASSPLGIRRQAYDGYNLFTYGQLSGTSVHNDGELYGAIGWRMLELFGTARLDELFGYMVDGMNYTPSAPAYEDMRDGILQSIATPSANAAADSCLVWQAFAQYGVGEGASSEVKRIRFSITESFALPAACQP